MRKGTYLLSLTLLSDKEIDVGSRGKIRFPAGKYFYAGSAMNGLDRRIGRHFSREKKMRWHIDYLTVRADAMEAYVSESPGEIGECRLAETMEKAGWTPVKGFGCSDCGCYSHLFRAAEKDSSEPLKVLDSASGSATTLIIYQALPTL
ncbi:MAG: GIY-YIG nuclease family protein [Candidatus Methanomethylophilaceae archaeon]